MDEVIVPAKPPRVTLDVQPVDNVTVVRFPRRIMLDGPDGESVGEQLLALVQDAGRCRLVVNCARVDGLTSATIGKLITVHKKALPLGGRLALCQVPAKLLHILETVKLPVLIGIYDSEQEAVQSFLAS